MLSSSLCLAKRTSRSAVLNRALGRVDEPKFVPASEKKISKFGLKNFSRDDRLFIHDLEPQKEEGAENSRIERASSKIERSSSKSEKSNSKSDSSNSKSEKSSKVDSSTSKLKYVDNESKPAVWESSFSPKSMLSKLNKIK